MAAKLVMTFAGADGANVTFSYGYAKSSATASNIKALVNGLITNGSIFANPPVTAKSAQVVITSENVVNLSE